MKKNIWTIFIMMVLFTFIGCGKKEEDGKLRIGVAISSFGDQFIVLMVDKMRKYNLEKYGGELELTFVDAKNDPGKQLNQVENFITQGVDAIICLPVDSDSTDGLSQRATDAGIPIIYTNRPPKTLEDGVWSVGSDQKIAGVMQMEYLAEKMGGKGNVAILLGTLGHDATIKRTAGVEEVAAKYPDIKIIKQQTALYQRPEGLQVMENWLSSGDQIDAVASNNDEMAIGAINAIDAYGKGGKILVGGVDGTPDALDMMSKGKLAVTIFQDGQGQGAGAIDVAYKVLKGETVDQVTNVPFKLITEDNYKEFMK